MSWISISDEQLNSAKMAPLIEALRTAALASGQDDPVGVIVGDVVGEIRNAIATGGMAVDGASAVTIPPSLLRLACRLIIWEGKSRLEYDRAFDESDHREDLRTLDRLRLGKQAVEVPESAEAAEVSSGVSVVVAASRTRVATRTGTDGLL